MRKIKTGLSSFWLIFRLDEREEYEAAKRKYAGYYQEVFINNEYCIEVTKRTL